MAGPAPPAGGTARVRASFFSKALHLQRDDALAAECFFTEEQPQCGGDRRCVRTARAPFEDCCLLDHGSKPAVVLIVAYLVYEYVKWLEDE